MSNHPPTTTIQVEVRYNHPSRATASQIEVLRSLAQYDPESVDTDAGVWNFEMPWADWLALQADGEFDLVVDRFWIHAEMP